MEPARANMIGATTQPAGTVIQCLVPPLKKAHSRIDRWKYTGPNTQQQLVCRMALGRTTLTAAAAVGATTLTLAAQPSPTRNVAANDYLVAQVQDQNLAYRYDIIKVSSASGLVLTVPALADALVGPSISGYVAGYGSPAAAGVQGADVWLMSLNTDVVPGFGLPPVINVYGSAGGSGSLPGQETPNTEEPDSAPALFGMFMSPGLYEPLIFESNNVNGAGVFEFVMYSNVYYAPGGRN